MQIWKLLSALAIDAALFAIGMGIVATTGPSDANVLGNWQVWVVIGVAWLGLALKLFLGDVVSDKFEYHKHGYDFCTLAMGTALTALALQVLADRDLFPLLPTYGLSAVPEVALAQTLHQRTTLLAVLFILSVFLSMLAARISRAVADSSTRKPGCLAFGNFLLGVIAFAGYFIILVAKAGK